MGARTLTVYDVTHPLMEVIKSGARFQTPEDIEHPVYSIPSGCVAVLVTRMERPSRLPNGKLKNGTVVWGRPIDVWSWLRDNGFGWRGMDADFRAVGADIKKVYDQNEAEWERVKAIVLKSFEPKE